MLTQTKESPENTRCDASPAARRAQARVAALRSIQQHCRGLVRAARIRAIRRQLAARGSVLAVLPRAHRRDGFAAPPTSITWSAA